LLLGTAVVLLFRVLQQALHLNQYHLPLVSTNMSKMTTRTPPSKVYKQHSGNPFDSDSESELNSRPARGSTAPVSKGNHKITQPGYIDNEGRGASSYSSFAASNNRYKNDFRDSGGLENQSVQELEGYAAYKAEETTKKVNGCLKIAEEIREDASRTLVTLHQQGEQITRTHLTAANIDHDLSRVSTIYSFLSFIFTIDIRQTDRRLL